MMMVVEDMDIRPPRKMDSIELQPRACPTMLPVTNMPTQTQPAVIRALLPTLSSFLKLNSSPRAKSRKMMPISDHCSTDSLLEMPNSPRCGPTMKPAMI